MESYIYFYECAASAEVMADILLGSYKIFRIFLLSMEMCATDIHSFLPSPICGTL